MPRGEQNGASHLSSNRSENRSTDPGPTDARAVIPTTSRNVIPTTEGRGDPPADTTASPPARRSPVDCLPASCGAGRGLEQPKKARRKPWKQRSLRFAALFARLLVGGLFIYAAQSKIIDPVKFAEEVRAYELAPVVVTNAVALTLPWAELFAGLLLVLGVWRTEAGLLILLMLAGFTLGKISVEVRGMDVNCGCWGNDWMESTFHGIWGILLNLFLAGLLLVDLYEHRRATAHRAACRAAEEAAPLARTTQPLTA